MERCSLPFQGVAEAALDCTHRTTVIDQIDSSKLARFSLHRVAWLILDCARSIISLEGRLDGLLLRVSNEGLPRPRVARAKETV